MAKHTVTDPACIHYSTRRKWRNNRGRGKGCPLCCPPLTLHSVSLSAKGMGTIQPYCDHGPFDACRCMVP